MGCGQSKIGNIYPRKSKSKGSNKRSGVDLDSDEDGEEADRGAGGTDDADTRRKAAAKGRQQISSGPLLEQTEMSSSQMDFFRMLDEKIESGPDYDSASEEEMALEQARLCSLLRDWETASLSTGSHSAPPTPGRRKPQCNMNGELQYVPQYVPRMSPVHHKYYQPQPQHNSVVQYRKSRGAYTELA